MPKLTIDRSLKWMAMTIMVLIAVPILLAFLVHLSPVQNLITHRVSNLLSETIQSEVTIENIHLSIWDGIAVKGLQVNDQNGSQLLVAARIGVMPVFTSLLTGKLDFHYLGLKGFRGKLEDSGNGLNIQFIIDAFTEEPTNPESSTPKSFLLDVDQIKLEDIQFSYHSASDSISIDLELGSLLIDIFRLSTIPNKIAAHLITANAVDLDILSQSASTAETDSVTLPSFDFNTGFEFVINAIELQNHQISYHSDATPASPKFSPKHIDLDSLRLNLSNVLLREDSLTINIDRILASIRGLPSLDLQTKLSAGLNRAQVADLEFLAGNSKLDLELSAAYTSWSSLPHQFHQINMKTRLAAEIFHQDLSHLLRDSIQSLIASWDTTHIEWDAGYGEGNASINSLSVQAGTSQLNARGTINRLHSIDSATWDGLELQGIFGPEFLTFIQPISPVKLPSKVQLQLTSKGYLDQFDLQAAINSNAGNIALDGKAGIGNRQLDMDNLRIKARSLQAGAMLSLSWLGSTDFSLLLDGTVGVTSDLSVSGEIDRIYLNQNRIMDTRFDGRYRGNKAEMNLNILDPHYTANLKSEMNLGEQTAINTTVDFSNFKLGKLINMDSTLLVSSKVSSDFVMDQQRMSLDLGLLESDFESSTVNYSIDTLTFGALIASDGSELKILSDHSRGSLTANFDIREAGQLVQSIREKSNQGSLNRSLSFNLDLTTDQPLKLLSSEIEKASDLYLKGSIDESKQIIEIGVQTGSFQGFGLTIDSLSCDLKFLEQEILAAVLVEDIIYDALSLGDLSFRANNPNGNGVNTRLLLERDSLTLVMLTADLQLEEDQILIDVDSLVSLNQHFSVSSNNPVVIASQNAIFDRFAIRGQALTIDINGTLDEFEFTMDDADLTQLNKLIPGDSSVIHHGRLDGLFAWVKADRKIHLQANIDSLTIKDSPAVNITARASTEGNRVPFSLNLNSVTNNIGLTGAYALDNSEVDANLNLDINQLKMFDFLTADKVEYMDGKISGQVDIGGKLNAPEYQGELRFHEVQLITLKPRSSFFIRDEVLRLDNSGLTLQDFTIDDPEQNSLRLNGTLSTENYRDFDYDLTVDTDNYLLINNPRRAEYQIQGTLVIGSNLSIKGNQKDLAIQAAVTVRDTTSITYVMPPENLELLSNQGIVEFVDPNAPEDSLSITDSQTFYDSLIATFPEFKLQGQVKLEEGAVFQVIVNANSGDYIEASGAADLRLDIDRTGKTVLEGSYSIRRGFYQLSFYDMVKKRFDIVPGSSIRWTGNPDTGELNFKATHKINSSSVGLIGHEISENERELYRKPLPYEVGIVITGTLESPVISFDLDLPKQDKTDYPALANKLDRLKQPEFESELNKQVFGLLVLGGFIPEASTSEFDQSLIATTALSNSVNSILASQLNRFAGQVVKGVDVNVAMQSYSDYATGTGNPQTRTTMDVTLSKRMMDDRLSIEVGAGIDINSDQSGAPTGSDNFRGDITVIYDLTESGDKQLKLFNNETYDIIYHEIRNTGISLIFIKDFDKGEKRLQK